MIDNKDYKFKILLKNYQNIAKNIIYMDSKFLNIIFVAFSNGIFVKTNY